MSIKITQKFNCILTIEKDGLHLILIKASCSARNILKLKGEEDLKVEIDDIKFREIPPRNKSQYFDIPPSWNGAELKGLNKTVIFLVNFSKGKHLLKFIPKNGAVIEGEAQITLIEDPNNIKLDLNEQAQDENRRPWIAMALVNLPLKILDVSITCEKRERDSDDVQLIIDGKIQENENYSWWGKNWYWQGRQLNGATEENRFYLNLKKENHYIEFWADRMPKLNNVWLSLGTKNKEEQPDQDNKDKKEEPKIKTSEEVIEQIDKLYAEIGKKVKFGKIPILVKNFNKYDKEIEIAGKEFDIDPVILKATIAQESSFGKNIEHDKRYIGESGLMGLEKLNAVQQLKNLGYNFNYTKISDVIRASAAYYNWVRDIKTTFDFKGKNNPLKLYTQYRSDLAAEGIYPKGIPQFLFYYFYYKE